MIDILPRIAREYGESMHSWLLTAGIRQSLINQVSDRIQAGKNVQGFTAEFFLKLQSTYPDLNLMCFFEEGVPIRKRNLTKAYSVPVGNDSLMVAEKQALYGLDALLEAKDREIALLNKHVAVLEELLDGFRKSKSGQ